MDELENAVDELENEVIEELGENPMRAYKLQFPYQVKFCLAGDDHRTEVIINTISEEMTFARTKKDALLQKERNDAVSKMDTPDISSIGFKNACAAHIF